MKTVIFLVIVLGILAAAYFFLIHKKKKDTISAKIDCSKYWSLNSIDKAYCAKIGKVPDKKPRPTDIAVNVTPKTAATE